LVGGNPTGSPVIDPANAIVGVTGKPLGNGRLVAAIPTNEAQTGPLQLQAARVIQSPDLSYLGDPSGNLVGDRKALWLYRLVYARKTIDTRRL
jgi:hypothetical protein